VGPSKMWAPFAMDSLPMSSPPAWSRSLSHVAAKPVPTCFQTRIAGTWPVKVLYLPQGKQAAGTPLKNLVPLTPLGPSDMRTEGTPRRGTAFVCQKSMPHSNATFSSMLSLEIVSSTSRWNILRRVIDRVIGDQGGLCTGKEVKQRRVRDGGRE